MTQPNPRSAGPKRNILDFEKASDWRPSEKFRTGLDRLLDELGGPEEPELLPGHAIHEAFDDLLQPLSGPIPPEAPWAIGPIIAPGDCVYIVGLQNTGKTTLAVDILWSALAPNDFNDDDGDGLCMGGAWKINRRHIPHGATALIINAETTSVGAWKRKFVQRAMHAQLEPECKIEENIRDRVKFLDAEAIPWENRGHLREEATALAEKIVARGFKFVVIDPIYNFFDANDNGDATWVTRGLKPFIRRLKEGNVQTLCLAHPSQAAINPKASRAMKLAPFGSTQQNGVIDASFALEADKNAPNKIWVILTKSRSRDTQTWIPRYDSKICLTFSPAKAGYSGFALGKDSKWEYVDPGYQIILGAKVRKMLATLPPDDGFTRSDVFRSGVSRYYWDTQHEGLLSQRIITAQRLSLPGSPVEYSWTKDGRRERAAAAKDHPNAAELGKENRA